MQLNHEATSTVVSSSLGMKAILAISMAALFLLIFSYLPYYFLDKISGRGGSAGREGEGRDSMPSWKSGLLHFLIGGLIAPYMLTNLFYYLLYYCVYISAIFLDKIGNFHWSEDVYAASGQYSDIISLIKIFLSFIGVWIGTTISAKLILKFPNTDTSGVVKWSSAYMSAIPLLMLLIAEWRGLGLTTIYLAEIFGQVVKIAIFYVASQRKLS